MERPIPDESNDLTTHPDLHPGDAPVPTGTGDPGHPAADETSRNPSHDPERGAAGKAGRD